MLLQHLRRPGSLIWATALLVLFVLGFMTPASAQTTGAEHIDSFTTDITVTKTNVLQVSETIIYDFGTNQKHGIYRDIPTQLRDGSDIYYVGFSYGQTVGQNNNPVQADVSEEYGNARIRLGDPDRTVTGLQTYKISYSLSPMVYKQASRPFLNLDVIGTGFEVGINRAAAVIRLEGDAQLAGVACFTGIQGSTQNCSFTQPSPGSVQVTRDGLFPGEGITINAFLPDDYIGNYLIANQKPPLTLGQKLGAIAAVTIPILIVASFIGGLIILVLRSIKARRLRKAQTVIPQYDPPAALSPAEIGHLDDDSSSVAEVTATIIDMSRRGHIKIQELPKPGGIARLFGRKQDYELSLLDTAKDQLSIAESLLKTAVFGADPVKRLSNIDQTRAASGITQFKSTVLKGLKEKGYYASTGGPISRGNLTEAGAKQWATVDGFKLYINVVEKDRLAFTDAPERTPERFSALLPYAIALGVEKQWAKQFEGIDISDTTSSWYSGNNVGAFSAAHFASSLNSGFASTLASNSTISSGGGSSGGGGGGGGGGSW